MGDLYYADAAVWLRGAGLTVVEVDGWKTRARSSGGFDAPPLGIQWHHTASQTSPQNDAAWQATGSEDAPIGNATIMRDGSIWMISAGAANTAGKGGPWTFSRGVCPVDGANSRTWAWEAANGGTGEAWPQVQMDAYFAATIEMNRRFGNAPDDVVTHQQWAPTRKIDPATAANVQGPWRPRSTTSSGTWSLDDIRAELRRRAEGDDDMALSDDDVRRIAEAVWASAPPTAPDAAEVAEAVWDYGTTDPPTGKPATTEQVLGWARHAAANADKQTKP